jgi:Ser/Thr protein kinase RdoA (MazF antagonist)
MSIDPDQHRSIAAYAASRWRVDPATISYVNSDYHTVFKVRHEGEPAFLRLAEPRVRSFAETQAECDFLAHLEEAGINIADPIRSQRNRSVESVTAPGDASGALWSAVLFTAALGDAIPMQGPQAREDLAQAWGHNLGRIHSASAVFRPVPGWQRKHWNEEAWIRNALLLLPSGDEYLRVQFEVLMAYFRDLPQTPENYGLTHGDYAPNHVHVTQAGVMTTFAFGHSGYHWYMWDIAAALSYAMQLPKSSRHRFRTAFLRGYGAAYRPGLSLIDKLDWFLRLWIFNLYLLRRWRLDGATPTGTEAEALRSLDNLVHQPISWRDDAISTWQMV